MLRKTDRELDKFYTSPEVAESCIRVTKEFCPGLQYVEPSAGSGVFSSRIPDCIAYDIAPEHPEIVQADFLQTDLSGLGDVCIIGNPPFGKRNKLTKEFIKHSISFPNVRAICFVLPACFRKLTMQRAFPKGWSLVHSEELPRSSFLLEGEKYHVPCVFQVWLRETELPDLRERKCLPYCDHFEIVSGSRKSGADLFCFGAAPHRVIQPQDVEPNNRGYFLKSRVDTEDLVSYIKSVDWKSRGASSVNGGVFWVSSDEFVKYYCEYHNLEIHYVNE